jgi:hypothetical protein
MTMFAMVSLALTMLLGFAWAVLAQDYVSQMTPRIRYCGSGAHRSSVVGLFEGQNAEQHEPFRTRITNEGQRRCGTAIPAALGAARAELCEQDNQLDESSNRTISATRIDHDHLLLQRHHPIATCVK